MWNNIIVGAILTAAAVYALYRLFIRPACGCGCRCGCDAPQSRHRPEDVPDSRDKPCSCG
ncbi:MAG: hypothetical protein LBD42_03800 [Desulfovibrio sp.]|nr:hypothetical protein [Desulfovibrio sp.]